MSRPEGRLFLCAVPMYSLSNNWGIAMAELATRPEDERAFEAALQRQLATANELMARYLAGEMENPPEDRDGWIALFFAALLGTYVRSATQHGMPKPVAEVGGKSWARPRAIDMADRMIAKQRAEAERIRRELEAEKKKERRKKLRKRFGVEDDDAGVTTVKERRPSKRKIKRRLDRRLDPEVVVTTETTAAATAGGEDAVAGRRAESGKVAQADKDIWWTEQDAKVCPICEPLHGKERTTWSRHFPKGPPAHPRCRCNIEYAESEEERPRGQPTRLKKRMADGRAIYEEAGIRYTRDPADKRKVVVVVDVAKLDQVWANDAGDYIPPGGGGAEMKGKRPGFVQWRTNNPDEPIEMPNLAIPFSRDDVVRFGNGRHRFSVLRDQGVQKIPVLVDPKEAERFREQFG